MSFGFFVHATDGRARCGTFDLPHGPLRTPVFMPVATQGAMKGVTADMLDELDIDLILGNTYHLGLLPGRECLEDLIAAPPTPPQPGGGKPDEEPRGLHLLEGWKRNFLTDSGGFQLVSLQQLCDVTEEGVRMGSTHGSGILTLKPEDSIHIQNAIGSDIMMQLDDVVSTLTVGPRVEEAMRRSIRWLDRCVAANLHPATQGVFAIVQGALDHDLRRQCVAEMSKRKVAGFAIGGLSGGEKKDDFWQVVSLCCSAKEGLPANKPRYCMGVGHPLDIIVCIALGVDMFDCVYPCRTARFGTALTTTGLLSLRSKDFAADLRPLDADCSCRTCRGYTRAYLHTVAGREAVGATLISLHNIAFLISLTRRARNAIRFGTFHRFVRTFVRSYGPNSEGARCAQKQLTTAAPPSSPPADGLSAIDRVGEKRRRADADGAEEPAGDGPPSPTAFVQPWVVAALASVGIDLDDPL